ncbi:hypothetical protein [Thermodesulforhabdus norvegica]|uniref:RNA polymerase sigma factor, sigma-70 family n=1 Tax=Thermodesulforhabdus norvegica TaxID=39841 RepID=A0A1I4TBH8_9BACT|nr:hypothetical protein [Thermodesulforhabdus norvegica]SFM74128.1 RNA polymerase sigma factor, sigma-70 family [Thermodesulforhabdus norvegica]
MTWQEWLKTEQAWPIIQRISQFLSRRIRDAGLQSFSSQFNTAPEDLAADLWIYLCEHADEWEEKKPFENFIKAGNRYVVSWIVQSYLNHLRDKIRVKGVSPARYLYSRLRTVLSSHPEISFARFGNAVYYSFDGAVSCDPGNIYTGGSVGYSEWAFPEDVSEKNIYEEKTVIRVAEYFWRLVARRHSRHLWVGVKDLAGYIMSFLNLPVVTSCDGGDLEFEGFPDGNWNADYREKERNLMKSFIRNLAGCCAARLSDKEKEVILKHLREGKTLERIADEMNYSSASSAAYIKEKAYEKIRDCCVTEPNLSPPDLDREIFNDFMEYLLEFCKKSLENRNNK